MTPRLRPGTHLLRRRDDRWQLGLDPARRVLLPSSGRQAPPVPGPGTPDDSVFRSPLPGPSDGTPTVRHTVAALAREVGDGCPGVLERRAAHLVRVEPFGPDGAGVADELVAICGRSGLRHAAGPTTTGVPRARRRGSTVVAVAGVGEPPREALDRHVREEVPHLLVRIVEGRAVIGPFVVPGRTPCVRCLDGHLSDADPSWPLLVEQYVRAVARGRPDGVPEPVDAALAALAAAWAARDLATWAEGGTPTTIASTIEVAPRLETVETRQWSPHPRCGCSWR